MNRVAAFVAGLAELLLLREAEARARAVEDSAREEASEHVAAARLRLRAARRLGHPIPAIVLLREARDHAARAVELLRPASPEGPSASPPSDVAVSLELDRQPLAELEALRDELDLAVTSELGGTETRSVFALRVQRWARVGGLALALILGVTHFARARVGVRNLALGKPVTATSLKMNPPSPAELVDGRTRGTIGIHTNDEAAPQITIDLESEHTIDRVVVWNRGDGWFDDSLPLLVDTSRDGVTWDPLARRTEHFDRWESDAGGRTARFVRVHRTEPGYIALNEVEVFGR